jgi:hypothetical protein
MGTQAHAQEQKSSTGFSDPRDKRPTRQDLISDAKAFSQSIRRAKKSS